MAPGREIERKFLVSGRLPFALDRYPCEEIKQGYIAISPEGTEVRIRARGGKRTLGVKSEPSASRVEEEIDLEQRRFDALWPLTEPRRIEKRRYVIPADEDRSIELDVYDGELAGLVTAEIEFSSEQEAEAYEPAPWLGADVTGDARYSNQSLATRARPAM
jgi:adenylate cyclase